jgi:hypothetical protein
LYLSNYVILLEIYDMMNNRHEIDDYKYYAYCTFNLKGELILQRYEFIHIYSIQTVNNKWKCKRTYRIPDYFKLISISIYDKLYLFSNNSIYEWNLNTEKGMKISDNDMEVKFDNLVIKNTLIILKSI